MSVDDLLKRAEEGLMVEEQSKLPMFVVGNMTITAKEARELANSNPDHPSSKDLKKAVEKLADDYSVNIDKANLYAITQNKSLETKKVNRNGEIVSIRVLSDKAPEEAPPEEATTTTTAVGADSSEAIRQATREKEERAGFKSPGMPSGEVLSAADPSEAENRQLGAENLESRSDSSVEPNKPTRRQVR